MAWKPKEKPLSADEAIALARRELAPRWLGSSPLIAAFRSGDAITAHPLDPAIGAGQWLLFFVDPMDLMGEHVLEALREWQHRYSSHGLGFIAVLNPTYEFVRDPAFLQLFAEGRSFPYPIMVDADGMLAAAFHVNERPHAILLTGGKSLHEASGEGWEDGLELTLQKQLRQKDPGLPLLPQFEVKKRGLDVKLELGAARGVKVTGNAQGLISIKRPVPNHFKAGEFFITGDWVQTRERIETQDPAAAIGFHVPRGAVSVIACSMVKTAELATIAIELGGVPAYDSFGAGHLESGDDGQSVCRVGKSRMYHLLRGLPERERDVILRFPMAKRCPVGIYGFRFAD